jgi:hypothetical protein
MTPRLRSVALIPFVLALVLCPGAGAGSVTVSPLPGTPTAMPQTQISFLGAAASSLKSVTVVGSLSGTHTGRLRSYTSALGASFQPSRPFTPGEHVTVRATLRAASGASSTLRSTFTVAHPVAVPMTEFPVTQGTPADVQGFHSSSLHPPAVIVHQPAGAASAPGYVFAAPFLGPGQYGPMIFDSAGNLVWFHPLKPEQDAADFRTQVFRGKNALTWWQGRTIQLGYGLGEDVIANANYKVVSVVRAGNGLQADEHEFTLTPQGSAYVLAYSPVQADLASAGGTSGGVAVEGVIQEIDIHTGLVMWEWHSLSHVGVAESYSKLPGVATAPYDYFHINSLFTDSHGDLLISARNTWALYSINPHSGGVRWRLGGKRSTFKLGSGVQFAFQHDAEILPNGDISLFDDEGAPPVNPPSRGEVVRLDQKAKTATLVSQLIRTIGPVATGSQGNVQALQGGGHMVGWGGLPNFTEFDPQGQIVYDAQLPRAENSYRVYREPWNGQPGHPPAIAAVTSGPTTSVYASWNGATTVVSWQLLTGSSAAHMTAVSTTPRTGFETTIPAAAAAFFQVRALSASGRVLGASKTVAPTGA